MRLRLPIMICRKINPGIGALYQPIRRTERYPKDIETKGYSAENMKFYPKSWVFINRYAGQNVR